MTTPIFFKPYGDAGVLAKFRSDEVGKLVLHGVAYDDSATKRIKGWSELATLDLGRAEVDDNCIADIMTLPKLVNLSVAETNITTAGIEQMHLDKLRSLNMSDLHAASELIAKLLHSQDLTELYAANTGLTDEDLGLLGDMPHLQVLNVCGNPIISDKGLFGLTRGPRSVQRLFLDSKRITPSSCMALVRLPLTELEITTYNWNDEQKSAFLKVLTPSGCHVTIHGRELPMEKH